MSMSMTDQEGLTLPHNTPPPSFIRRIEVAPGQPVTIPTTHVTRDAERGYRLTTGIGRQASTPGADR